MVGSVNRDRHRRAAAIPEDDAEVGVAGGVVADVANVQQPVVLVNHSHGEPRGHLRRAEATEDLTRWGRPGRTRAGGLMARCAVPRSELARRHGPGPPFTCPANPLPAYDGGVFA